MLDENTGVDVTDIPTPADSGTGAETQIPENIEAPAAPTGFDSAFGKAREAATARVEVGASDADSDEATDDSLADDAAEPDETVPGEKEDEEAEEEEEAKVEDETGEKPARDRTRNFKEVAAENETLKAENIKTTEKLAKLDNQFKQYGGVDVVETAMDVYDKLANGQTLEVINELPAHERTKVQQQVFVDAISKEANRVFGVNQVLTNDFGLEKPITQPLLEKAFEFITHRLNTDGEDFETFLDRELEFINTPEKELERVKAENERLKNPSAKTEEGSTIETEFETAVRVNKTLDVFEDETFSKVIVPEIKTYGLEITPKDTPAIKEAKETLQNAVQAYIGRQMREAQAFTPLLEFWAANDTKGKWYNQAAGNYERAMKAKVQVSLKAISRLFNAKSNSISADIPDPVKIPAPNGKTALQSPKPKPSEGGGFSAAFNTAKKQIGVV